jgi:uncharacterized protein YfkK (UPF0435 family)
MRFSTIEEEYSGKYLELSQLRKYSMNTLIDIKLSKDIQIDNDLIIYLKRNFIKKVIEEKITNGYLKMKINKSLVEIFLELHPIAYITFTHLEQKDDVQSFERTTCVDAFKIEIDPDLDGKITTYKKLTKEVPSFYVIYKGRLSYPNTSHAKFKFNSLGKHYYIINKIVNNNDIINLNGNDLQYVYTSIKTKIHKSEEEIQYLNKMYGKDMAALQHIVMTKKQLTKLLKAFGWKRFKEHD